MNSITIIVEIPSNKLSPHAKGHWREKAKLTKESRHDGLVWACEALAGRTAPKWKKARLHIRGYFKTKCRWDDTNLLGACKGIIDGCADAGIVENDRGVKIGSVDTSGIDRTYPRLELTFIREN